MRPNHTVDEQFDNILAMAGDDEARALEQHAHHGLGVTTVQEWHGLGLARAGKPACTGHAHHNTP